ncbi:arylsulfatase [Flavobacterium sp. UMI-01]|uniref:arylsulfatase n=1 Tax=Flavobacterium sp. UMI-01 TaxID=1441053 RepID=UPI001C7D2F7B|nr:arylsulfatase [Flavobacterium sp. UMI-01]GIZ09783.1 N-acetylgalactosamine-6-sulfatase [Flavobacterium sp. UMI-01]
MKLKHLSKGIWCLALGLVFQTQQATAQNTKKPNVIIIITDDQGYGDLGCTGNPIVKTPHLDQFYKKSVRLTDFHVGPTCAPSRSGLMTGRYANRVGVWHTIGGVSILREKEVTMANVFQNNGYETGMFGKWHLGDSYPSRPQDKGFKHTLIHGGGGVGQTPDYWNNDYFDDTYLENGVPKKVKGYCTDVWFDEAMKYIETNKDKPFFCYIAPNAPHLPFNVPADYYNKYKNEAIPEELKKFYAMITNVDDNFKRLQDKLKQLKLDENTIVIFLTDNGTASGYKETDGKMYGYNANMKGIKNSEYEGGHRVPFFISYPAGKISGGRDVNTLAAHLDVLPSLATICKLEMPKLDLDGSDISSLLLDKNAVFKRDYLITDSQRVQEPIKWRKSAVMSDKMRLVNGTELYDVSKDPGQNNNIAAQFPDVVAKMRGYYEEWWSSVSTEFNIFPEIIVGSDKQNPVEITCHDEHVHDSTIPWNQDYIREGKLNPIGGEFTLNFDRDGVYEIEVSRWPFESGLKINEGVAGRKATTYTDEISEGKAMNFKSAVLKIGAWKEEKPVSADAKSVLFKGNFTKGKTAMSSWFIDGDKKEIGTFYFKITRIGDLKRS